MDKDGNMMSDTRWKKAAGKQLSPKKYEMFNDFQDLVKYKIGTQKQFEEFINFGDKFYENDWFWVRKFVGKREHYNIYKAIKNVQAEMAKDKRDTVHLSKPGIRKLLNDNLATMVNENQKMPLFKQSPDIINIPFLRDLANFARDVKPRLGGSSTRTPFSTSELFHINKRLELHEILKNNDGLANVLGNLEAFIAENDQGNFEKYVNDIKKGTNFDMGEVHHPAHLMPVDAVDMISAFLHPRNHTELGYYENRNDLDYYVRHAGKVVITILGHSNGTLPILGTRSQIGTLAYINGMSASWNNRTYQKVLLVAAQILAVKYHQIVIHDDTDDTETPRIRLDLDAKHKRRDNTHAETFEYFEWFADRFVDPLVMNLEA